MKDTFISSDVIYIGADDKDIDLFESQYIVPNGISYNSYLIRDEKITIMDTIDKRKTDEWIENLEKALKGDEPYYLVVSHVEPDHAYNIEKIARKYPNMKLIGNEKTFAFLPQFFEIPNLEERKIVVKEGEEIPLDGIVISGNASLNTSALTAETKLYEVSKENCKNVLSIQTKDDLDINFVKQFENVGVIAGASTPDYIIQDVINTLSKL